LRPILLVVVTVIILVYSLTVIAVLTSFLLQLKFAVAKVFSHCKDVREKENGNKAKVLS